MTRKEATERIKAILKECTEDKDSVCYVTSDDADALDMAIKALEREPCEDCISRQAAIDALDEQIALCNKALGSFDISMKDEYAVKVERASLKAYRETLNVLPSAQPETAKRIVGKSRNGMTLWYQCDMCNEPVDAQDDFCRGCGRRLTDG